MNTKIPYAKPTVVDKTNPFADAATLIDMILAGDDSVAVAELHTKTGWPLRRFNLAIAIVIHNIDEQRVGQEMGNQYPTGFFFFPPADKVQPKQFLARLRA